MNPALLACILSFWPSVESAARHAGVPPQLALAVVMTETHCDHTAVPRDSTGQLKSSAKGHFQVLRFWTNNENLSAHCGGNDLTNVRINHCFGTHILRHYERRCNGDWMCALTLYGEPTIEYRRRVRRWLQVINETFSRYPGLTQQGRLYAWLQRNGSLTSTFSTPNSRPSR